MQDPGGVDWAILEAGGSPRHSTYLFSLYGSSGTKFFWYSVITASKSSPVPKELTV